MNMEKKKSIWIYVRWVLIRILLIIYDVAAVYLSGILALLTRFYVANEFKASGRVYFEAFMDYAPFYVAFCILVFAFCKMYSGRWKYAGFNDFNRLITAAVITLLGHIAGTLLFAVRMPVTIYVLTAVFQFIFIVICRFSYRFLIVEKDRVQRKYGDMRMNIMIVGAGGTGMTVLGQLENAENVRPVCVLDHMSVGFGSEINGIPLVNGLENFRAAAEKYKVNLVIIASVSMPEEIRQQVQQLSEELQLTCRDYSGYFGNFGGGLTLRALSEYCRGKAEIRLSGEEKVYDGFSSFFAEGKGNTSVDTVYARGDTLVVELGKKEITPNDLNQDWVRTEEEQTGESVSFF